MYSTYSRHPFDASVPYGAGAVRRARSPARGGATGSAAAATAAAADRIAHAYAGHMPSRRNIVAHVWGPHAWSVIHGGAILVDALVFKVRQADTRAARATAADTATEGVAALAAALAALPSLLPCTHCRTSFEHILFGATERVLSLRARVVDAPPLAASLVHARTSHDLQPHIAFCLRECGALAFTYALHDAVNAKLYALAEGEAPPPSARDISTAAAAAVDALPAMRDAASAVAAAAPPRHMAAHPRGRHAAHHPSYEVVRTRARLTEGVPFRPSALWTFLVCVALGVDARAVRALRTFVRAYARILQAYIRHSATDTRESITWSPLTSALGECARALSVLVTQLGDDGLPPQRDAEAEDDMDAEDAALTRMEVGIGADRLAFRVIVRASHGDSARGIAHALRVPSPSEQEVHMWELYEYTFAESCSTSHDVSCA